MKVAVLGVVPPKADRSASGPDATSALPPGSLVWYDQVTLPELGGVGRRFAAVPVWRFRLVSLLRCWRDEWYASMTVFEMRP